MEKARHDPAVIEAISRPRVWRDPDSMIRAVLAAVWPDLAEERRRAIESALIFAAAQDDAARPVVDAERLAQVLDRHRTLDYRRLDGWVCTCGPLGFNGNAIDARGVWRQHQIDDVLTIVQDAADVRRAVLGKVEGALLAQMKAKQWDHEWAGLSEALRLVREVGEQ